jgi:hypothetical protein
MPDRASAEALALLIESKGPEHERKLSRANGTPAAPKQDELGKEGLNE